MAHHLTVVMGVFDDVADAERALDAMTRAGISRDEIAILAHPIAVPGEEGELPRHEMTGSGATVAGGTIAAYLLGIALFSIPLGGLLVAGPLAVFGGAAAMKPTLPGSPDALEDLGVPRSDARIAVECVRRGGIVIVVRPRPNEERAAIDAVSRSNAIDLVATADAWEAEGWTYEPNAPPWSPRQIREDRARRQAAREARAAEAARQAEEAQRAMGNFDARPSI